MVDGWNWDTFLVAAEKCHKAGVAVRHAARHSGPIAVDWVRRDVPQLRGPSWSTEGNITVKSDQTRQVLEYAKKLVAFLPPEVFAWDDASNNRALIAGKSAMIFNPPSAWAVAKRDAPQIAEQLWTMVRPRGPRGATPPSSPILDDLEILAQQVGGEEPDAPSRDPGVGRAAGRRQPGLRLADLHQVQRLQDLGRQGPPKGTLYH